MKVFKQTGSKERFLEMFQNVNKIKLNEAFGQTLNPQSVLAEAFNELKNETLSIIERKTETKGNVSYVQLICVDKEGNNITFTFKAQVQEGDQDGVYNITDVMLDSFSFDSAAGDDEFVEMKGETLKQFNAQHKNEMFDIVDEDINVEQEEEIDTLYEDAIKKIDAVPYKGGSEKMQTHKAYADEKPTNASVRVDSELVKKFVKEEYPEQLGKEFKPESQGEYAKKTKAEKKRKSKKVKIKESTDRDRYENVVFLQGDEAFDALERLDLGGKDAALNYLKQWHYPGEHEGTNELGHGTSDQTYEKDGYIMSWNSRLGYIGLQYDLSRMNEDEDENSELSQVEKDNPDVYPDGWKEMDGMFMGPNAKFKPEDKEDDGMSFEPAADEIEQLAQEKEKAGDLLQGGKADNKSPLEFDPEQIKMGLDVEKEHTDNPLVAVEIATDHLSELPDYYTHLNDMEKQAKEGGEESGEEKPEGEEEDKELTDELLGYKPKNVGDEVDETIGYDEYKGRMGDKYADAEGNEFAVSNKVKGGVTLKGQGGEKEVATGDLDLMKKMDEMGESKESELKQNDPATWHQIQIAKKTLKMPDAMVGVMGGMTKEEAKEILRKHNVSQLQELAAGKKTKMFKIGEYAVGGIIKVDITGDAKVNITALDWNSKQPVQGDVFAASDVRGMDNYLNELTSSFFAGKVMEWIEQNTGVSSKPNYFGNQNW